MDGIDNDCDGSVDEDAAAGDGDGDGYDESQGDCADDNLSIRVLQRFIMTESTKTAMDYLTLIKMAMAQILPTSAEQIVMTSIQAWKHWT